MRATELLRLVWLNINQNKFKSVMTSIGIVVGAATIVLVFGIGRGGQLDVAEQFAELNAGAIDVSYDYAGEEESGGGGGFSFGDIGQMFSNFGNMIGGMFGGGGGGGASGGSSSDGGTASNGNTGGGMPSGGNMPGGSSDGDSSGGGFSGGGMPGGGGNMPGGSSDGDSSDSGDSSFPGGDFSEMPGNNSDGESSDSSSDMPGGRGGDMQGGGRDGEGSDDSGNADSADGMTPGEGADGEAADGENPDGNTTDDGASEQEPGAETDAAESEADSETEEETSVIDDRLNQEEIILAESDVEDIERYVEGISGVTISYSTKSSIEGGNLTSAQTYTVAGVKESYESVSKLTLTDGSFITEGDDDTNNRVCVLGITTARELFGTTEDIVGSTLYIDDRDYTVVGVLSQTSTVSAGISPDTTIFIPYETGIKYITGEDISPVITVIAEDVDVLSTVIENVRTVLEENYPTASFTFEDSGSKMEAAQASNQTLTMLLSAMAVIVFLVGGIGIMNVLFVSVKERTNEIGILKAIGTSRGNILTEFLIESAAISCIGGILGVGISFLVIPIVEKFDVRIDVTVFACLAALGFAVLTGTIFGIYPAWKASRLEPVEALNAE